MTSVEVHVDTSAAQRALATIQRGVDNRAYLDLVGQRVLNWVDLNFREHGSEHPWKPLSPNTIASRRGSGRGGVQPLRDTGRLAQSFTARRSGDSITVGTQDQKAQWHHLGTRPYTIMPKRRGGVLRFTIAGRGVLYRTRVRHPGLPARPLLPSQRLAEELALQVLQTYVDAVIKEAAA